MFAGFFAGGVRYKDKKRGPRTVSMYFRDYDNTLHKKTKIKWNFRDVFHDAEKEETI